MLDATGRQMVDVGTADGHTPLHVAAVNGFRQIAQLLVEIVSHDSELLMEFFAPLKQTKKIFHSVLSHCWLGDRKGIRPVKKTGC